MKKLLEILSNCPEYVYPYVDWLRKDWIHKRCPLCKKINLKCYPEPLNVVLDEHPGHRLCGLVTQASVRIYHIDFIKQIRLYLGLYVLGKCFLANGDLVNEYVTCYTNKLIVIRGKKFSRYHECRECGSIFSLPKEPKYTLKSYLSEQLVYQDCLTGLYIDEDLAMEVDFTQWPDTVLDPVDIREVPTDERRLQCDPENPPWYYLY